HRQDRKSPSVSFIFIQKNPIVMVRKDFAKCCKPNIPVTRLKHSVFPLCPYTHLGDFPRPTFSCCRTLIAIPSNVIPSLRITVYVDKSWHIEARRAATENIFVVVTFDTSTCSTTEMVIHRIVAEFTRTAT